MSTVLDDMDSRPGSTTSLLRTVIGLYLRDAGGWMSSVRLIELMQALDVAPELTRTALTRLRKKDVLVAEARDGQPGYGLDPRAEHMLERGDRRIHTPRAMAPDGQWCLISFSVPESERGQRHQLRRQLHWIGCGMVSPGLWVCPDYLREEATEILTALGLGERAVLFTTARPHVTGELREVVSSWWDLEALASLHREFIELNATVPAGTVAPGPAAFAAYVQLIDSWRMIPYRDPGLPSDCLPANWPGAAGAALFLRIRDTHAAPSALFVLGSD
ncbi:PaaX family transcriptional regulator [Paeniglutamicibacter cryotolerans]|uniref:Phenylacetic acid degradation operon negative regulatory protein n=1 Tax=Paeniglutamicibacter cryotolerans TaxID=670079 RepID=A0A839QJ33_9MICC|nr:PaaX family transcriptional regulator C-terminal domain-containing protein [Paeniglutamicibacter cryotolerans]MBB2995613.1 phenylacetic acid degradation operon negative regulatory protein [Paeniglutamicibacter cryotolerans]